MTQENNTLPEKSKEEPGKAWAERKLPPVATPEDDGLSQHAKARQEYLAQSGGQHQNDEREQIQRGLEVPTPENVLQGTDLSIELDKSDIERDRTS